MLQSSGSQMLMLRVKPCQRGIARATILKCKFQCTDGLSAQRVSPLCRIQTNVAWLTATRLNHSTIGWWQLIYWKKQYMYYMRLVIPCKFVQIFLANFACTAMQDCHSLIAQVEYQGQTRYTKILDSKPLIDTFYCIGHRLELTFFSLHNLCPLLIYSVEQLIDLRNVKTENLKFSTDLLNWVMDGWSVTQ